MPVPTATELLSASRYLEMDIALDLQTSTVYDDKQVDGSDVGSIVYIRNGTEDPLVIYTELSAQRGILKVIAGRVLKRLSGLEYLIPLTFPGHHDNVIYPQSHLSIMSQISDVMIGKEEAAMTSNTKPELPDEAEPGDNQSMLGHNVCVLDEFSSAPRAHIGVIFRQIAKILSVQGVPCFECPKSQYKLYPLSNACMGESLIYARGISESRIDLAVLCGDGRQVCISELTLPLCVEIESRRK